MKQALALRCDTRNWVTGVRQTSKYIFSAVGSLLLYCAVVSVDRYGQLHRPVTDFTVEVGMPFTFSIEGGFGGLRLLMPGALIADIGIVIAISLMAGWIWGRIAVKRLPPVDHSPLNS